MRVQRGMKDLCIQRWLTQWPVVRPHVRHGVRMNDMKYEVHDMMVECVTMQPSPLFSPHLISLMSYHLLTVGLHFLALADSDTLLLHSSPIISHAILCIFVLTTAHPMLIPTPTSNGPHSTRPGQPASQPANMSRVAATMIRLCGSLAVSITDSVTVSVIIFLPSCSPILGIETATILNHDFLLCSALFPLLFLFLFVPVSVNE